MKKPIIGVVSKNITIEECSKKINKSIRTTKEIFKKLKEKNIIERVGSKKTGCWGIK